MTSYNEPRYINPYTDFGFKKLFEQAEIAQYNEAERRQYESSQKEYWDYTSTLETAENKGMQKAKAATVLRLKKMGLTTEQIAEAVDMSTGNVLSILSMDN